MTEATYKCFDCGDPCRKVRVLKRFDDGRVRCFDCRKAHYERRTAFWIDYKTHYMPSLQNVGGSNLP
jgi:hypothetical protein